MRFLAREERDKELPSLEKIIFLGLIRYFGKYPDDEMDRSNKIRDECGVKVCFNGRKKVGILMGEGN